MIRCTMGVYGGNYVEHEIPSLGGGAGGGASQGLTPSVFQTRQVRSEGFSEYCVHQTDMLITAPYQMSLQLF